MNNPNKILVDQLKNGMTTMNLNFSFEDSNTYKSIGQYFDQKLTQTGTYGKGVLSYKGKWNANFTTFLGSNEKLGVYILVFCNKEGIVELEIFRKNFLNLQTNQELAKTLSVSNVKNVYITRPEATMDSPSKLESSIQETVNLQQKSVPKVSIEDNNLFIGGKTGNTCLQIGGNVTADFKLKSLVIIFKMKDQGSKNFYHYLLNNINTDYYTIVAFFMLNQLGRVQLSTLLKGIQSNLVKNYDVGKVATYSQTEERATTSFGKYVLRSLSGIKNKLNDEKVSEETQKLLINWIEKLKNEDGEKFKVLLSKLQEVLSNESEAKKF